MPAVPRGAPLAAPEATATGGLDMLRSLARARLAWGDAAATVVQALVQAGLDAGAAEALLSEVAAEHTLAERRAAAHGLLIAAMLFCVGAVGCLALANGLVENPLPRNLLRVGVGLLFAGCAIGAVTSAARFLRPGRPTRNNFGREPVPKSAISNQPSASNQHALPLQQELPPS
ncbi:MAG: hypothetical protein HYZ53_02730 [Planctomycetes bacterium]|nr:hypothetical protein [Planctomycetota bacterium]